MTTRLHVTELLDEILRIFDVGLRTSLSLQGVYRGPMAFLDAPSVASMVNGIWVHPTPNTTITPIQLPSDLLNVYRFRVVFVRRIGENENVCSAKEAAAEAIIEKVIDNYNMPDLTLTNGQVLWWLPTSVEWEPRENNYVASLAEDVVAVAFQTELHLRTRR